MYIYVISAVRLGIGIFLLSNIGSDIDPKNPISQAL